MYNRIARSEKQLNESNQKFGKNKRRLIKPRSLRDVGFHEGGKIFYPTSVKSASLPYSVDTRIYLRGFWVNTHYNSMLTKEKKPLRIGVWSYTNPDTLEEYIGLRTDTLPIFVQKEHLIRRNDLWCVTSEKGLVTKAPSNIIVPHRKTLDNHGLNITLFQKENYLAFPTYLKNDKENIKEGWVYAYNTVVNGREGIYMECISKVPFAFRGEVYGV